MSARRRLLFVSPRFLFPANEGGKIRTSNILRHMRGGAFDITLASPAPGGMPGPGAVTHDFAASDADKSWVAGPGPAMTREVARPGIAALQADIAAICDRFVPWPSAAASRIGRIGALFGALPVAVATDRSAAGSAVIRHELATRPDLVVVDFPHAAVLLPDGALPPSVIFTHNVEAEIFERHAAVAGPLWRQVWRMQAAKMRVFEGAALRRFDAVVAVSERDAKVLARDYALPAVERIDTGVDLDFHRYVPPAAPPPADGGSVVFCGAMDWRANIDGIAWMMDAVWPLVLRARPAARAVIVGRNPPQTLIDAAAARGLAWNFTGYVDDVRPYVLDADVYVIPLRVGSGTRIKAFEAMAAGRPVVSTAVGIEGLAIAPEAHFLAADEAPAFAAAILRLLDDAALRARLAAAARALLEENFSWTQVARQFEAICLRALASRGAAARGEHVAIP